MINILDLLKSIHRKSKLVIFSSIIEGKYEARLTGKYEHFLGVCDRSRKTEEKSSI